MADTFTSKLRVRLQQTGINTDTWGSLLNAGGLQLLEDSIAGSVDITIAGSDVTLTTANGATDQARYAILNLIGAPGAARNVIVPNSTKIYFVSNNTTGGFAQTVKTAAGTGVSVTAGSRVAVLCDAVNVGSLQTDNALQLGGVPAASYARLDVSQNWTKGQAVNFASPADGATITIDCTASNNHRTVLGGSRIIALSSPKDGQHLEFWAVQDGTGGRTLTWPSNVRWVTGVTPTLSIPGGSIDRFRFKYHLSTDIWSGEALLNSPAASSSTYNVTLDRNEVDVDIFARVGQPAGVVTVNVVINPGVLIQASSSKTPALDFSGFAATSVVNLFNYGYVIGKGGQGGWGGALGPARSTPDRAWVHTAGTPGFDGGNAIIGPGTGRTFNITNASGRIWGGGGGGGGGGAGGADDADASGGGGGGGAGGGLGGQFIRSTAVSVSTVAAGTLSNSGVDGTTGRSGTFGAAGAAYSGTGTGTAGGAGGDFGAAGNGGTAPAGAHQAGAGPGGAAGKAIELSGGAASFVSGSGSPQVKGAVS